jgi:transcriptional regulator with XRE-family HTH domain
VILKCNIKEIRELNKMTQAELSSKSDVNLYMISAYENNRSTPTIYTLWRLAEALGCKVDDLYSVK